MLSVVAAEVDGLSLSLAGAVAPGRLGGLTALVRSDLALAADTWAVLIVDVGLAVDGLGAGGAAGGSLDEDGTGSC